MRQQVQWVHSGSGKSNECWHYVSEYLEMEWLKKLGFTRAVENLDVIKASLFVTIGTEFQRLTEVDRKRSKGK